MTPFRHQLIRHETAPNTSSRPTISASRRHCLLGPGKPEEEERSPTRYGDWEKKGIAIDF